MADRERIYDQSRDERDEQRPRRRDFDARLDDRSGVEPGSPGGYRAAGRDYGDRSDPRYDEARSFEPPSAYHSEFAEGEPARRPDHELSEAEYRRRRGYYRGADFGRSNREPAPRPRGQRLEAGAPAYGPNPYPTFNPYDSWGGIGPSFGFGYDLRGHDRPAPAAPRPRADHDRHIWDMAADEVSSWMGDEAAHIRREMDRGEHAGRGPKGYKRSDACIKEDVSDRLTNDSWLDASEIEVEVKDAEVTLSGHVASRDDKKRAELWAESISGVDHVQNNLRVDRNWHSRDRSKEADEAEQSVLDKQARGNA